MYDVIVVGARCAGSSTARLLAEGGLRTLVVDRATFPSDTVSTHAIDPVGMGVLARWGLVDKVLATNAPAISKFILTAEGAEFPADAPVPITCPRRTVLDKLLLDEARAAGVDVREGVTVKRVLRDDSGRVTGIAAVDADGTAFEERATIVVGADGMNSFVAREVDAERYGERCGKGSGYYAYYSDTPFDAVELAFADGVFSGIFPTNDDQACVFAGRISEEFAAMRGNPDEALIETVGEANARLGEGVRNATRASRFYKYNVQPGFFRKPYGDGWALVGDAGFHIDPVTGRGIGHAFRDAELLSRAIHAGLGGADSMETAMGAYQETRDRMSADIFRLTHDIADLEWRGGEVAGLMLEVMMATVTLTEEVNGWPAAPGSAQVSSPAAAGSAATS